jgi:hypothetical protein
LSHEKQHEMLGHEAHGQAGEDENRISKQKVRDQDDGQNGGAADLTHRDQVKNLTRFEQVEIIGHDGPDSIGEKYIDQSGVDLPHLDHPKRVRFGSSRMLKTRMKAKAAIEKTTDVLTHRQEKCDGPNSARESSGRCTTALAKSVDLVDARNPSATLP